MRQKQKGFFGMSSHYSLRPETIEKISAAQVALPPSTLDQKIQSIELVIEKASLWRAFCFSTGALLSARTTAIMIGVKRVELRELKAMQ